jgi:hypothetical protein
MSDKVTGKYVTMKVADDTGQRITLGFYEGAPVPDSVSDEDRERLRRKGLIAAEDTPEAEAAVPHGVPVTFDDLGHAVEQRPGSERSEQADDGKPKLVDPKERWVDYAVSQRSGDVSEEDARAEAEGKTKAELVAQYK